MKIFLFSAKTLFLLLLVLNIPKKIYCQDVNTSEKDDYREVIFEIPPVVITRYEYEKNLNKFIKSYTNINSVGPSENILDNWRNEFIDKMYLLAELYTQDFDKREDVLNTVNSMERIILTQDHGLVYDEFVTKKVNFPEEAFKAAYEKSGKYIKVECLKFPDYESLSSLVSRFKTVARIETSDDFNILAAICNEYPEIKHDTVELVWPYLGMDDIAEKIYNLEVDEIIPPTERTDGVYVYYARDVDYPEKKPYEKIRSTIQTILEKNKETALRNAFYRKLDTVVISYVDEVVSRKFMQKYDIELFEELNESIRTENLRMQFKDILKDTMLFYSIDFSKSFLTVEDFLKHYSHSAMLSIFADYPDLSNYLSTYARDEYLLQLADSLGIKKSIKHQLDKKNYKNKTMLSFYEARELIPNIQVSDDEIENFYQARQSEYISGETAEISVYTFDTKNNAFIGNMNLIRNMKNIPQINEKKFQYNGLKQVDRHISVTRNNNNYSNDIIREVFKLKDEQYSLPIKWSGDFIIIKKIRETGSIAKPIEDVRDDIILRIKEMKCDKITKKKILTAKKKYQIRVNKI